MNGTEELESKVSATKRGSTIRHKCILTGEINNIAYFKDLEEAEKVLNSWRYADEMINMINKINNIENAAFGLKSFDVNRLKSELQSLLNKVK